jgi:putative aldouronate transport system permease protein
MSIHSTGSDRVFETVNLAIMTIALLTVLYPLYFIVISSVSDPDMIYQGRVWLLPKGYTLDGYRRILSHGSIWIGFRNSFVYMGLGTAINLCLTLTAGYALSRKDLKGKGVVLSFFVVTMFLDGGLIPRYLVVRQLGLIDSVWAMVLPKAVAVWNLIISRTFFRATIPEDLAEAALMDGCSTTRFFVSIAIPLSQAIIAVMALFYGVAHWNSFFDALVYLRHEDRYPLQLILRNILIVNDLQASIVDDAEVVEMQQKLADLIKYGVIIVASAPLLILYPFLQKYFVQGIMIGAIKG